MGTPFTVSGAQPDIIGIVLNLDQETRTAKINRIANHVQVTSVSTVLNMLCENPEQFL